MMIDSSAIIAVALKEPEAQRMATAIAAAPERLMSAVNWLEVMMVVESRHGTESADDALALLREFEIATVPFDQAHMKEARDAWRRYGRGRHPAALNMGDCCAYAAALVCNQPLLFKGNDFPRTDIPAAEW